MAFDKPEYLFVGFAGAIISPGHRKVKLIVRDAYFARHHQYRYVVAVDIPNQSNPLFFGQRGAELWPLL
jgi:hypothetical protein